MAANSLYESGEIPDESSAGVHVPSGDRCEADDPNPNDTWMESAAVLFDCCRSRCGPCKVKYCYVL